MDWNWFFSSLAQSAAAIVGIFGAFIITKILSNQSAFSEKKNRLRELLRSAEKLSADAKALPVNWYNNRTTESQMKKLVWLLEDGAEENAEKLYDSLDFSPFIKKAVVLTQIKKYLDDRKEGRRIAEEEAKRRREEAERRAAQPKSGLEMPIFGPLSSGVVVHARQKEIRLDPDLAHIEALRALMTSVAASIRDCRHHMALIADFRNSIRENPESSPQITYTLMGVVILFYVGVIYPLSFMPLAATNATIDPSFSALWRVLLSFRGALLGSIALIFSAVLLMFFDMNRKLKYSTSDIESLRAFSHLGAYSDFYNVMMENEWAQQKADLEREAAKKANSASKS